jgi:glyoxylase-like metal-dependent hydrolase (beta-lactamase superfamily II)
MRDSTLTRRRLLFAAGSGVLGVAVISSCSDAPAPSPPAPPPSPSAPSATTPAWQRVNLSFVSAYLLIRSGETAVVDLGTDGSAAAIEAALKGAGTGWGSVKHILLTHQHPDHAGGLASVIPQVNAAFYAGAADVAGITSAKPLKPVEDGDEVFGLQIIGTPGHTAGHISIFDPSTGTLVAGDALRTTNGLEGSDPRYTADATRATASVRKLAALDVKTILPGHGDPLTTGAADALRKLAGS